jgi:hypothetical protein
LLQPNNVQATCQGYGTCHTHSCIHVADAKLYA